MAKRIHKHISRAFSKRKESKKSANTPPLEVNESVTDLQNDELLSQRLDLAIESALNTEEKFPQAAEFEEEPEEISLEPELLEIPVEEEVIEFEDNEIIEEYKAEFNNLLYKKTDVIDELEQNEHHLQAIENVIASVVGKSESLTAQDRIIQICDALRQKELDIQNLCINLEKHRQALIDLIDKLKALPAGFEKEKLITFFETKINNHYYQMIKSPLYEILSKGKYLTDDDEIVKAIIFYVKTLVILTPYEYGLLSNIIAQNPTITNPYNSIESERLNTEIDEFLSKYTLHGLEKVSRFIHHALTYDAELISQGKRNESLATISFSKYIKKSLHMLIQNPTMIETLRRDAKIDTDISKIKELETQLTLYQNYLNEFGNIKIQLTFNKSDFTVIKQIQLLHEQIDKQMNSFGEVKKLKAGAKNFQHDANFKKVYQGLSSLSRILLTVKGIIKEYDVDNYGIRTILVFRVTRGDFFSAKDRDNLISATFAIHKVINPLKLFNGLIENYKLYSEEKQKECLFFVKNYLLLDTDNSLINIKYEQSEIIEKIEMFCQFAINNSLDNHSAEAAVDEISEILVKKIVDKSNSFSNYINMIAKGEIPQAQLVRRVNTIIKDLPSKIDNKSAVEECLLEVNFILESPNFISYHKNQLNEALIVAVEKLCEMLQQYPNYLDFSNELASKLNDVLNSPPTKDAKPPISENNANLQHFDINTLIHEIINNTKMMVENEKSLALFVNVIESGFIALYVKITLAELREVSWVNDNKRMAEGLMPLGIHIRQFNQYFNLVVHYFSLAILNQIEESENKIISRESLFDAKKIYEFIDKSVARALDRGAMNTAVALNSILNLPPIRRLNLGNQEILQQRNNQIKNAIAISDSFKNRTFVQEGLPYLNSVLDQIGHDYKKQLGSEFEKRYLIGRNFQLIEEKKDILRQNLVEYDLLNQMRSVMKNASLLKPVQIKDDIILNDSKIMHLLNNASENLKPQEFKSYQISDFHTIPGIRDQLSYWYNRMQGYHIVSKNPESQIIDLVKTLLTHDPQLEQLSQILQILTFIEKIDAYRGHEYKNYNADLNDILKIYLKKIKTTLKEDFLEPNEALNAFFTIFNKDSKINAIIDSQADHGMFSSANALMTTINELLVAQQKYTKAISMATESRTQQAYSQLLLKVLEGDKQAPIIQIGSGYTGESDSAKSLLPESEFPVPQAEPEHPDYIGINRTMNFNPDAGQRSTLELFSTIELKKDFLQSFPWGLDTRQVHKLANIRAMPDINLVALDHIIHPHLQLTLMKYILLSLDCLGKLAGSDGELSIVNFTHIKNISDSLQDISNLLIFSELDNEVFITKLDHMTYKLILLNKDLNDDHNQGITSHKNDEMNEFCHLNEYITHKLLGVPYQKSILTPLNPQAPMLEKLPQNIKEDLLRHSGVDQLAISKLSKISKQEGFEVHIDDH